MTNKKTYDVVIVGAGIVALTVALELRKRFPEMTIAIFEKEADVGRHASGRNSGVLHAGIYYGSDTLKAKVCSRGSRAMQEYATERGIRMEKLGKVIVASRQETVSQIDVLEKRAKANNIRVERLDAKGLAEYEPHARSFGDALFSPDTAVIDSMGVLKELIKDIKAKRIDLFLSSEVKDVNVKKKTVLTTCGSFEYGHLINSAGAYADKLAHIFSVGREFSMIPFKGTYFKLISAKNNWVRSSIYPAPDLRYPFLGVHLTRSINGEVYLGPSAIPALGRENYHGLDGVVLTEAPVFFVRLARMYLRNEQNFRALVHSEISKYNPKRFLEELKGMVPDLVQSDIVRCDKAGIRPQLVNTDTWSLEMDFRIEDGPASTHILNAISPAFTGSMAFAQLVVDRYATKSRGD